LAGELLDTPQKHHVFMWVYSVVTVVSALVAIQQGSIGADIDTSSRALGLAEGANSAARYFIVAMIFLNYLRTVARERFPRFVATLGTIITFFGVFFTVSRTGILLIFAVLGMLFLLNPNRKYRVQLLVIFIFAILGLWLLSDNIVTIVQSIMPSISQGTDTAGLRYALWKAGWRMWLHYPFQGVGIGMYPRQLRYFGQDLMAPLYLKGAVAHNTYVQILAETGLIGFGIFMLLLIKSLQNIWRVYTTGNEKIFLLRNVWLVVLLAMLLGGITKTDYADTMIWLVMGVSIYFKDQIQVSKENSTPENESKVPVPSYSRDSIRRPLTR
jgi:O-antigen ligase